MLFDKMSIATHLKLYKYQIVYLKCKRIIKPRYADFYAIREKK
jgi:hypothetical protein